MLQKGLTGNQLKILALITMTVDHVGLYIFPYCTFLRIIGRLAMPLFAFMIAEGCRYTRSRARYFLTVAAVGVLCQIVYAVVMRSLYQCIMVTFSFSIVMICLLDWARKRKTIIPWCVTALAVVFVYGICEIVPQMPGVRDFAVDYGFWGVMLPVLVYLGKDKMQKMLLTAAGLVLLAYGGYWIQWFSLCALPLLALYNGKRGAWNLKYLFYTYYPAHLVVLYGIGWLLYT